MSSAQEDRGSTGEEQRPAAGLGREEGCWHGMEREERIEDDRKRKQGETERKGHVREKQKKRGGWLQKRRGWERKKPGGNPRV